jgi:hypothetical protein
LVCVGIACLYQTLYTPDAGLEFDDCRLNFRGYGVAVGRRRNFWDDCMGVFVWFFVKATVY